MKSTSDEFRARARKVLEGNWNTLAVIMLVYVAIAGALASTGFGSALDIFLLPMAYAIAVGLLRMSRGGEVMKVNELFTIYRDKFVQSFVIELLVGVFTFLWALLFIIPGIIMAYAYGMAVYIQEDHPEMSAMDCIRESKKLMDGHKWELFCLDFSFIGWWLLVIVTCGIASLWVGPYMQTAHAEFYRELIGDNAVIVEPVEEV